MPPTPTLALEINGEWAALILAGTKTVELRAWALPGEAVGRPVALLVPTHPGAPGAPALAPWPALGPAAPAAIVGWAVFGAPVQYASAAAAAADEGRHCVPRGSPFLGGAAGRDDPRPLLFGWPVTAAGRTEPPAPPPPGRRLVRSLWALDV